MILRYKICPEKLPDMKKYFLVSAVAVILYFFLSRYFSIPNSYKGLITEESAIAPSASPSAQKKEVYLIKSGDTLSSIALKYYGYAGEFSTLVNENNIEDPDLILAGNTLIVPPKGVLSSLGAGISGGEYAVRPGDNLWIISVRAYQDGYRWPEIAKASNLADPDVIHSGNRLLIPRP